MAGLLMTEIQLEPLKNYPKNLNQIFSPSENFTTLHIFTEKNYKNYNYFHF